ncbi:MAG TPA: ABC transporter ATP-binding protein, partial [Acidimicrobiales bacterium]|nr:ABC transporter ATP-binding protein [Acidimicrobiales bacterium]
AYRVKVRAERAAGSSLTVVYITFALGTAALLAAGAWLYRRGEVTLGTLFLLFQCMQLVRMALQNTADQLRSVQRAGGGAGRIRQLLARRATLTFGPADAPRPRPLSVRFEAVSFGYGDGRPVLDGIDLEVPAGSVLGVVGRTGGGKTTIARLLARLYDPDQGVVSVGGVDLRTLSSEALRHTIGLVTQDVQLFHASVRDNLTMFGGDVDDARLAEVIDQLELGPWLARLPDGLDSVVGAGGVGLSAGEAQLLAFGRVLISDPAVVVLDEASSRLDPLTEARIDCAVARLLEGRTGVVIAHRPHTLTRAASVVVVEGGHIVESGPRSGLEGDPASRFSRLLAAEPRMAG